MEYYLQNFFFTYTEVKIRKVALKNSFITAKSLYTLYTKQKKKKLYNYYYLLQKKNKKKRPVIVQ